MQGKQSAHARPEGRRRTGLTTQSACLVAHWQKVGHPASIVLNSGILDRRRSIFIRRWHRPCTERGDSFWLASRRRDVRRTDLKWRYGGSVNGVP